jgi:hypothetical protein
MTQYWECSCRVVYRLPPHYSPEKIFWVPGLSTFPENVTRFPTVIALSIIFTETTNFPSGFPRFCSQLVHLHIFLLFQKAFRGYVPGLSTIMAH